VIEAVFGSRSQEKSAGLTEIFSAPPDDAVLIDGLLKITQQWQWMKKHIVDEGS
jgi:hypothetical protein